MARGGYAELTIDTTAFANNVQMVISRVDRGTKKATQAAVEEIYAKSQEQVPRDTGTLANSGYYYVTGNYRSGFRGVVGYGAPGNYNERSGSEASEYAVKVHEDLSANHPHGGKAKYLEDPIREFQSSGRYATLIINEIGL